MQKKPFEGANDPQTGAVIAAAIEVHKTLDHGFLEKVYAKALELELNRREIPVRLALPIPVYYKGDKLSCGYEADAVCYGELLVELKAQSGLCDADVAQVINYLRGTNLKKALLLNFGAPKLQIRRIVLSGAQAHAGVDDRTIEDVDIETGELTPR